MVRHQVILIGRRMESALIGVKEFHPDVLHLLYTNVTSDVYEPLLKMLPEKVNVVEYETDPYDFEKVKALAVGICDFARENTDDQVQFQFNVTEGTKVAAGALIAAAQEMKAGVVYYTQEGECVEMPVKGRRPISVRLTNREIIELFGNNLTSHNLVDEMPGIDVVTSYEVKHFLEANPRIFHRIQKQFRSDYGARLDRLPTSFVVERENNIVITVAGGRMKITQKGKPLFDSDNEMATRLFFTGRWWECVVSDKVNRWDKARHSDYLESEVWRNVEFSVSGASKTKNELDILVNDRTRLILIECKSGYIAQENIYKIDSTRRTYGGSNSKGLLVSYYPLDEWLVEKCRDLHLYYFAPKDERDTARHLDELPIWLDKVVREIE